MFVASSRHMLAQCSFSSSAPLSVLSLAGRAGHAFIAPAMMEGFACHARGVELVACGATRVHARVRSKRIHDVLLRAEEGRLSIACTCPARAYGLDFCKHAWAALLEVDRQDGLSDLRRTRGPLVVEAAPPPPAQVTEGSETMPRRDTDAPTAEQGSSRKKKASAAVAAATPATPSEPRSRRNRADEKATAKAEAATRTKAAPSKSRPEENDEKRARTKKKLKPKRA